MKKKINKTNFIKMVKWKKPDTNINIYQNETHVWLLPLELESDQLHQLRTFLSDDEMDRAERVHFDKQRNHYIAARGQMRKIINNYLRIKDEKLVFVYNEFGKPYLENNPIHFNLSHSHESENEFTELNALPANLQRQGFFNCWTRKESYIKARGVGLGIPLSKFEVSLKPDESVQLKSTQHDPEAANKWKLYAFDPYPDYTAALTINTNTTQISFWDGSVL
ncbi:MAG: 4'-phosphopantetheinyl transferase superfamily protein [Calditrichaceae bacterium]